MIIGFGVVVATWALADWIVPVVFQRGAFTSYDTALVTQVLRFGVLQLPFVFGGLAMVQWIAAKG